MKRKRNTAAMLSLSVFMSGVMVFNNVSFAGNEISVKRIGGNNRYSTSYEVSKLVGSSFKKIILANGTKYPDALSGGVLVTKDSPMILTDGKTLSDNIRKLIESSEEVIILGGENSVSKELENSISRDGKKVTRIAGSDRYETSVKIAEKVDSKGILVASGETFPDALSGSALAQKENRPIVLTKSSSLPKTAKKYIKDRKVAQATILGGNNSVSSNVESELKEDTLKVNRIAGSNRYDTSVKIANFYGESEHIVMASGEGFADALSSSSISAKEKAPILLTGKSLDSKVKEYIDSLKNSLKEIFVVGGEKSVPNTVIDSINGKISEDTEKKNPVRSNPQSQAGGQLQTYAYMKKINEIRKSKEKYKYFVENAEDEKYLKEEDANSKPSYTYAIVDCGKTAAENKKALIVIREFAPHVTSKTYYYDTKNKEMLSFDVEGIGVRSGYETDKVTKGLYLIGNTPMGYGEIIHIYINDDNVMKFRVVDKYNLQTGAGMQNLSKYDSIKFTEIK